MSVKSYMSLAICQAEVAMTMGEIPIGAVIVKNNEIIAFAHNLREKNNHVASHAEMIAIEKACNEIGNWRLSDCDIFVTMEPCPMCAGAIIQARIRNVYFGCYDKKGGAFGSVTDLSTCKWTHKPNIYGGIMEDKCSALLKMFFLNIRNIK